jgi:K+-sensing histidine kinase KdpD
MIDIATTSLPNASTNAEALLAKLAERDRPRLRIYVGAAPGVGKTYRMLRDANELRRRRLDVTVGFVETFGRLDTEAPSAIRTSSISSTPAFTS